MYRQRGVEIHQLVSWSAAGARLQVPGLLKIELELSCIELSRRIVTCSDYVLRLRSHPRMLTMPCHAMQTKAQSASDSGRALISSEPASAMYVPVSRHVGTYVSRCIHLVLNCQVVRGTAGLAPSAGMLLTFRYCGESGPRPFFRRRVSP